MRHWFDDIGDKFIAWTQELEHEFIGRVDRLKESYRKHFLNRYGAVFFLVGLSDSDQEELFHDLWVTAVTESIQEYNQKNQQGQHTIFKNINVQTFMKWVDKKMFFLTSHALEKLSAKKRSAHLIEFDDTLYYVTSGIQGYMPTSGNFITHVSEKTGQISKKELYFNTIEDTMILWLSAKRWLEGHTGNQRAYYDLMITEQYTCREAASELQLSARTVNRYNKEYADFWINELI